MPSKRLHLLLLTFAAALSGCKSVGGNVRQADCPQPQPVPPSLMQPAETEKKVRAELFQPPPAATHK